MKKFVFVLMPFNSDFDDVYKLGIKNACTELDMYCERVDEQYYEGSMLERIYNQINHADYIIADLSTKNPNVFYEVGYAHALNKKVILITQNGEDIPFDMKHYLHIIYSSNKIAYLKEKIQDRLKWYINNDSNNESNNELDNLPISIFVNNTKLEKDKKVNIFIDLSKHVFKDKYTLYKSDFTLALLNTTNEIFLNKDINYDFTFPNLLPLLNGDKYGSPEHKQVITAKFKNRLHPSQWTEFPMDIRFDDTIEEDQISKIIDRGFECEAILLKHSSLLKYQFTITLRLV